MYTLIQAKWTPTAYDRWIDTIGTKWVLTDNTVSPDLVAAKVAQSFFHISLQSASKHFNGYGMQDGIDVNNTMAHLRNTKTNNQVSYQYVAALETIMAGACWPASRIHAIKPSVPNLCPRCNMHEEDSLHTFWTCPHNRLIEESAVQNSQYLIDEAVSSATDEPCLWLRGILPSHHMNISDEYTPSDTLKIYHEFSQSCRQEQDIVWDSGLYYGDASGGVYTQYAELRRVGVGLTKFHNGTFHSGIHCNLPGTVQTVGRGELFALLVLARSLNPSSNVEFVTDNQNVQINFDKGEIACALTNNADLYKELFMHIKNQQLSIKVRWMPSHLKDGVKVRPCDTSDIDIEGNDKADGLAETAAKFLKVPDHAAKKYIRHANLVKTIQKRLATILMYLPKREKS